MSKPQKRPTNWKPPEVFEEYRLLHPIGRGGMGQVYLGHDVLLDRPVAVKFIAARSPDARARQRFLIEARAVARLQHENVVSIYRVGEVDNHPFLVSELVRGQSLGRVRKPVPWQQAQKIALGLSRGLAAAHRHGVLHRDIKPSNVMLTHDGEVKLLDFGVAKFLEAADVAEPPAAAPDAPPAPARVDAAPLTQQGILVGTPLYMAPEVLRGEPATRRSDVYSLGAVIYELCTGRPPGPALDDDSGDTLTPSSPDAALPPLGADAADHPSLVRLVPGFDPAFAAVLARCLRRDPALRFASGDELRDALEQLAPPVRGAVLPAGNPYRGLLPFEAEHRDLFFGRGPEVRAIVERLRSEAMVLLAGDSGVGKSSLCRAGVLPLLGQGELAGGRSFAPVMLVPGRRPLWALAAALSPRVHLHEETLASRLRRDPVALGRALREACGPDQGILLFIDQMEELVTLSDPEEAALVGRLLGELCTPTPSLRMLLTARGDFLARLASLPGLGEELGRALYFLRPLSAAGTREAIVGPAERKGVRFESEELVQTLVDSSIQAAGGLPLLQFALAELWEARDPERQLIRAASLREIGGVAGALAFHADGVLAGLLPLERLAAQRILVRLVTLEGTRARRTEPEFGPHSQEPESRAALEALIRGRLVVARHSEGQIVYEIAHEALVQGWGTLRGWLDRDLERRAVRQRVEAAAAEWERLGRAREALWSERLLKETAALDPAELAPREALFLAESRRLLRQRRLSRRALALAVPIVVGLLYGGVRMKTRRDLGRLVSAYLDRAQRAVAEARQRDAQAQAERRRSFALYDQVAAAIAPPGDRAGPARPAGAGPARLKEAEQRHAVALLLERQAEAAYQRASQALEAALALDLDQDRQRLRRLLGDVTYERILLAEQRAPRPAPGELLQRLSAYDDDGSRRRRLGAPARLSLAVEPAGARLRLQRYEEDEGRLRLVPVELAPALTPGSYLLLAEAAAAASAPVSVRYPLLLSRGEEQRVRLTLPPAAAVPAGYLYVPPGRFLFGSGDDEELRLGFLNAEPLHPVDTGAYLIGRTEVTFADWIEYLRALPAAERRRRLPRAGDPHGGRIELAELPDGAFQLTLQPAARAYSAREGQPLRYAARARLSEQDWRRFPVSAISFEDAQAYLGWLRQSGRLSGARLCTEHEWERAARGADARRFPHGDDLAPEDANYDETYGRDPLAFGPDAVGAHPASRSPFGADDMSGNVWEWTLSVKDAAETVLRGGSWYHFRLSDRVTNRELAEPTTRNIVIGMRVCAPVAQN